MAKLTTAETEELLRVFVKAQNKLKGTAIDMARLSLPVTKEDRQFSQFRTSVKSAEAGLRLLFSDSLADAGIIEPQSKETLLGMR